MKGQGVYKDIFFNFNFKVSIILYFQYYFVLVPSVFLMLHKMGTCQLVMGYRVYA